MLYKSINALIAGQQSALPGNASNTYIVTLYDLPTMDLYGCKSVGATIALVDAATY